MVILGLAVLLRLLHVFTGYYVINHDSFYFHQQAENLLAGQYVPIEGSGLVYPVAGLASIVGIKAASIIFPLFLTVVMGGILHWFTEKHWNRTVANWTLLCYAVAWPALFMGYAGMLDRDLLSVLLVGVAVFDLKEPKPWMTLLAMLALFILWSWLGVAVILVLIAAQYLAGRLFKAPIRLHPVIIGVFVLGIVVLVFKHAAVWDSFVWTFNNHVSESGHNAFYELAAYWAVMIPLGVGVAVALKKREVYLLTWALIAFVMGFVSQRLMIFGLPAFLIICGIGFDFAWQRSRKIATVAIGMGLILGLVMAVWPPSNITISRDWVKACDYLRTTPEESVVLSSWDNGYWILDVAERIPYVDNGSHEDRDELVFQIYCATDSEAHALVKGEADYIVFSKRETNVWPVIVDIAGYNGLKEDTLYFRASQGFESEYFETVYRNKTVVVLEVK